MIRTDFEQGVKQKKMQPINDKDNNRNNNAIPRVLLTATSSGIGKTIITC